MNKTKLIDIANETLKIINDGKYFAGNCQINIDDANIKNVKIYNPDYFPKISSDFKKVSDGNLIIKPLDSFSALKFCNPDEESCVLNFASAKNPGGGFLTGASAQEEELCRCSTLYASLSTKTAFEMYSYNRENYNPLYSDYMLYSPKVKVIRYTEGDDKYKLSENPIDVSVITAPAVNRNIADRHCTENEIYNCMLRRAEKILCIAIENKNDNIILGAWGCGVFRNKAGDIAEIFKKLLFEKNYISYFKSVIFAAYNSKNADIFSMILK